MSLQKPALTRMLTADQSNRGPHFEFQELNNLHAYTGLIPDYAPDHHQGPFHGQILH